MKVLMTRNDLPTEPSGEVDGRDQVRLRDIERLSWAMLVLFTLLSLIFRSPRVTAGAFLGGLISILNFLLLKKFVMAIAVPRKGRVPRLTIILYLFKYVFLGFTIFMVIKYDIIHVLSFVIGLMIIVLAITIAALRQIGTLDKEGADDT